MDRPEEGSPAMNTSQEQVRFREQNSAIIVEFMYSLEELYAIFGDAKLADRLELLAYNGLPGETTPDYWAHQYDQQGANQVPGIGG